MHKKAKNFLTEAEVERFLQAAKSGHDGIRDHLMMLLMYRHGLRETELCRLTVSCLDFDSARIWVERAGLGRIHPRMLRHACGYALANKGHDLRTIQDHLGHRDPKHTAIFTRTAAKSIENLWH